PQASGGVFVGAATTSMGAAESAGVIAQTHWNNAAGAANNTGLALVDRAGAATSARIAWTAAGTWSTTVTDQPGNARMMKGYLDTSSTSTTTISVNGLAPAAYDVYVYADGANSSFTRTAAYTISGPGITATTVQLTDAADTTFSTTFTRGVNSNGNYVKFTINGGAFTVTAVPVSGSNTTLRAPVNGIQIVPVSAPPAPMAIAVSFVGNATTSMGAAESA